ncbi:unnamed protein product [Triticum turgidum subsp. durum]|uniref:R13L1/DRL21-like LRR repeat region domain-containing protein n=1 Tax=Triticum turgidum subsp. durum TaxID=4567 RepID=A0A9R1Q6M3_TRITD|nr:unnamed protein product [Triticum turgidum subsp. durum]
MEYIGLSNLSDLVTRGFFREEKDDGHWYCCCDLPKDLTNLAKLCRFYTPSEEARSLYDLSDEMHSQICNVEKLRFLEELKVFRVSKESEGFEPKQLEHLAELRELGIYNLENINKEEEATKANLGEKNYLESLTLNWYMAHIPWTETLRNVNISDVKLLEKFEYSTSSYSGFEIEIIGKDDLESLDQVLAFSNLAVLEKLRLSKFPPMDLKHLLMLTSLKKLVVDCLDGVVGRVGDACDVEWQHRVEHLVVQKSSGEELTELLTHLPTLSNLGIYRCEKITQLSVEMPQLSVGSPSCRPFPSFLQNLDIVSVEGMGTLEPLSNLTSLTRLYLADCGEDLRCKGLGSIITARGQLRELVIYSFPRFFAGWDPHPRKAQLHDGGEVQDLQQLVSPLSSSKLQKLCFEWATGLLVAPICRFLSSSLTCLFLYGEKKMERFTNEQEVALHLLTSLQELEFRFFEKLQSLPAGLHKLPSLKKLQLSSCPAVRSLPKDGVPKSLQELDVGWCKNKELRQECRVLVGTIPKIKVHPLD